MRLSAVETQICQTCLRSRRCLAVGSLCHMQEKPSSPEKHVLYKTHIMFPDSTETSPSDKSRHSKGIMCLSSITLRDWQKNYSSLLKSFRVEKHSQKCHVTRLYDRSMHIKQFTEAFQWNGQSLAPRALGGWGEGKNKTKQNKQTSFIKPKQCVQSTNQQ